MHSKSVPDFVERQLNVTFVDDKAYARSATKLHCYRVLDADVLEIIHRCTGRRIFKHSTFAMYLHK